MRRRARVGVLVGWLWADLLLALFAIFAVANTFGAPRLQPKPTIAPSASPQATAAVRPSPSPSPEPGIDPAPIELSVRADPVALLSGDPGVVEAERARVVLRAQEALGRHAERRAAVVLAFGHHARDVVGERLAEIAAAGLRGTPMFRDAAIRTYHYISAADEGVIDLVIYFHR